MKRLRGFLLAILAAMLGADGLAQIPESERTLVTDPDQLESMGFPRHAKYVYRAKWMDSATAAPEAPDDWGGESHFTVVAAPEFMGRSSDVWANSPGAVTCFGSCHMLAPIHLPTGVRVEAFRWWAHDASDEGNLFIDIFEVCHPTFTPGPHTQTLVATGQTTGSSGYQGGVLSGADFTVDNLSCAYVARVAFGDDEPYFSKLRIQWKREVSPSPATASFADVPTNHPFFQFIEALSASGITAGCGGGNFCPDSPVTRGQMAVFLAVAFGLYFP